MGHFQDSNIRPAPPIVFKSGPPISVICVAATYTAVTYANKGGKVQLSSAGVHGLTTSPAVGANVYVSWASGTGVSGLYKVLSVDDTLKFTIDLAYVAGLGTPTVAALSSEITIATIKLPTLSNNAWIDVMAAAGFAASVSAKQIRIFLNTTSIVNTGVTSISSHTSLRNDSFFSFRGSLTTPYEVMTNGSGPGVGSGGSNITGTVSSLSNNLIVITLKITAANEYIKLDAWKVSINI